jgi:integrase/recombinase XerD
MTFSESNSPMTPHQQRNLSAIAKRMAGDMKIRNLAQATIDAYTYHVSRFERFIGPR